jgi:hypothetical protein
MTESGEHRALRKTSHILLALSKLVDNEDNEEQKEYVLASLP